MNYQAIYDALIFRARDRTPIGYVERHHVVPRCMGGDDDTSNVVLLTAEEHFVAHKLLVKIHPHERGLIFGLLAMTMSNRGMRPSNKAFGWVRRLISDALSESRRGIKRCPVMMNKIWAGNRGRVAPDAERQKISQGLKGKRKSEEHAAKLSASLKGRTSPMKGRQHSEETKAKMREAATGRKMTHEAVVKMVASKGPEQRRAAALKAWETKRAKNSQTERNKHD